MHGSGNLEGEWDSHGNTMGMGFPREFHGMGFPREFFMGMVIAFELLMDGNMNDSTGMGLGGNGNNDNHPHIPALYHKLGVGSSSSSFYLFIKTIS